MGMFDFLKPKKYDDYFEELAANSELHKHNKENKALLIGGLIPEIVDFEYDLLFSTLKDTQHINISANKSTFIKHQTLLYIIFTDIVLLSKLGDKLRTIYMEKVEDSYYSKMAQIFNNHINIVNELQYILSENERLFEKNKSLDSLFSQIRQNTISKLGFSEYNSLEIRLIFSKMMVMNLESYSKYMLSELI